MLPGARASSSGDRRRLDRRSCPGPSMMMPNGFARWRLPRETDHSARTEPACAGKDWCITHPIGQRCTDDQPTIKGRTSANFGYSKPLFAYVHRTFGDQFIASARAIFFLPASWPCRSCVSRPAKQVRAPQFSAPADGRPRMGRGRDRGIFLGFVLSN